MRDDAARTGGPPTTTTTTATTTRTRTTAPAGATALATVPDSADELSRLMTAVRRGRVLTVTGRRREPAGRLVRELAHRLASNFFDGTAVVSMDRSFGPADLAASLGCLEGMPFLPCGTMDATSWLAERDMLLVLEGTEQLDAEALGWLRRLLASAPGVRILAAGPAPLGLERELVYRL
ncbi:hypothetical protein ACM614_08695 [Streptomyces sp. 12297]